MRFPFHLAVIFIGSTALFPAAAHSAENLTLAAGPGAGLAAKYPHDAGIERDPAVVFTENFSEGGISAITPRWTDVSNKNKSVMSLSDDVPPGSRSKHSIQITATRGRDEGGYLFKVLPRGYDQLYCRFYVKFAEDHGFVHHFVKMQGSINPPRWPEGEAGHSHPNDFTTGIEPTGSSALTYPFVSFPPPGIWHFYTYWPEMRSWQNTDGTGTSFYGNDFEPLEHALVTRGRWICVEFMVKMNSSPEKSDGEQAFWIDGKPAARFAPGSVTGYWIRDVYRLDNTKGKRFEGMRWRKDPQLKINKIWLLDYITEKAFQENDAYAKKHPDTKINTKTATAFFSDLIVSTSYIGPIQ